MHTKHQAFTQASTDLPGECLQQWRDVMQNTLATLDLTEQRLQVSTIAQELNTTVLDCAAAMLHLMCYQSLGEALPPRKKTAETRQAAQLPPSSSLIPNFRLVRYRLDLGAEQQLSLEQLKKVIVEESGVDINNIFNVRIQDTYTLVDLPDEMPQEIFHHLKSVEINGKKLDIRRVKGRTKKHSNRRRRQHRPLAATAKEGIR